MLLGPTMKRAALIAVAVLLPLTPLVLHARTTTTFGQNAVGAVCNNVEKGVDFDAIAQCNAGTGAGTMQTAPIILGTLTAPPYANTTCDSGKAGMLQWTGTSFQACGGTSWGSLAAGGALDDLTDAKTDYASLYNVFLGSGAGNAVTTGGYNTALGYNALQAATVGGRNTAIGYNALNATVTGSYNTAIGTNAGAALTTGTYNTILGNGVGHTGLTTGSRNILIGTSSAVKTPAVGTSNWLNIGNTIYGNLATGSIALGAAAVTIGATIDTSARTDSIILPKGTDAQRPTGVTGMVRYNTTSNCLETYQGGTPAWLCVGAANLGTSTAAASPYRTGQVNTGLFSPASGVVSVTTLGTERLRVDANGAVKIGAGAVTAGSILELSAGTGTSKSSMILPKDTTANRPTTATAGMVRFNTTTNDFEGYDGTDWVAFSAPGSGEIGEVKIWPAGVVPAGYLECNGAAVSRTTYAALFAVIGTTYGAGDGSTTFNLPDYRGEFIRGWANGSTNDPDAASRTNRGDGTAGDVVGSKQAGQNVSHAHDVNPPATASDAVADHAHSIDPPSTDSNTVANHAHGIDPPSTASNTVANHSHGIDPPATNSGTESANHTHSINPPSYTTGSGGTHTHTQAFPGYNPGSPTDGGLHEDRGPDTTKTIASSGAHTHVVDIPAFDSGYNTSSHVHATDIGLFASATAGGHGHTTDIALFTSATAGGHDHTIDIASFASTSTGGHSHTTDIASFASTATGGSETRPRNVNVMFIIRYQEEPAAVGSVAALTPQAFALSGDTTSTPVLFDGTAPVTMSATVGKIQGRSVASTAPTDGQTLVWNTASSMWQPGSSSLSILGSTTTATSPYRVGEINTGLYSPATGSVGVVSAGTEILRVTASGVGIGTTSPVVPLHVAATGASGIAYFTNSDFVNASTGSGVYIATGTSSGNTYSLLQAGINGGSNAGDLILNPYSGNVGIGTTNPAYRLDVINGDIRTHRGDTTGVIFLGNAGTKYLYFNGTVYHLPGASLNVNGTTYTSDKRLKTDIAPISKDSAMSLINKLEPKRFHWHPDSEQGKINKNYDFGMMAQDVQKILPEVVIETDSTGPDLASGKKKKPETLNEKLGKTLSIDYTRFVPWLIAGLQEVAKELKELAKELTGVNERVAKLEAENKELKARLKATVANQAVKIEKLEKLNGELKKENQGFTERLKAIEDRLSQ